MTSTKDILNAYLPLSLVNIIQGYALPENEEFKENYLKNVFFIKKIQHERKDNESIHRLYNIDLEKLTFFKYLKYSINQNYHAQQCIKTIGKLRADAIINKTPPTNLIYGKEALIIYEFLNYAKCGTRPLTIENIKLIKKLDKYFLSYSREELCYAVIEKSKKNFHMCCCKRIIHNNKLSFFCKRHLQNDININNNIIKNNLENIENFKIKSNNPLMVDNFNIEYKKIKKYFNFNNNKRP